MHISIHDLNLLHLRTLVWDYAWLRVCLRRCGVAARDTRGICARGRGSGSHQTRPGFRGPVYSRIRVRNCVQVSGTHWVGSLDELGWFQCRVCVSAQNSSSVPLQEALCCFLAAFAVLWRVLLRAPSGREHFNRFSLTQIFHHLSFIAVWAGLPVPSTLLCKKLA